MSRWRPIFAAKLLAAVAVASLLIASSMKADPSPSSAEGGTSSDAAGLSAFRDVASVLMSPRCLNCHIPGQSPLQGDDNRSHGMNVKRGADGRGSPAMRCTNCHQSSNSEFAHAPPGAPDWRLPAPDSPLAWQGLTTGQLCRAIKDPTKNGGRDLASLHEHVTSDPFVNWAWTPGPGRTAPPLSHQQFVDKFNEWAARGAPCEP